MQTPTYEVTITIGGSGQTTSSKIGSVLPKEIITRQSGKLIITAVDAAGAAFDLSSLGTMDLKAGVFNSSEVAVTLGTGVISGAGSNIFTASWVRDKIPAGWSTFAFDKDGVAIIYLELQETGVEDYFQWDTRLNLNDGSYTGTSTVVPVSIIQFYNPTYGYSNTITATDPGAGLFQMDAIALSSVTELYINDFTQSNTDLQSYWQGLGVGSSVYIGNPNVKLEAAYFTVSGTPVNGTDFTTVPVTFVSAGTSQFTNGSQFAVTIDGMGEAPPFTDANAILKNDSDNTKLLGFDLSAIDTATERTITVPNTDLDLTPSTGSFEQKLSGATLSSATVAGTDKVLVQDTDDSDNLKTVTAQSIADLSTSGITAEEAAAGTDRNETGTTDTLVLTDADNKIVWMNNAASNVVTIPTNASVAFPTGTKLTVMQEGAGETTVTGDTGVTVNGVSAGSKVVSAQFGGVVLQKRATNTWIVTG